VAIEAALAEDRLDLAGVVHRPVGGPGGRDKGHEQWDGQAHEQSQRERTGRSGRGGIGRF
jgi:hypothetical protein